MLKYILTFLPVVFLVFVGSAQSTAKYSNEFLSIGIGARALGMGNSVVVTGSDVTSGYWNPAGLLQIKNNLQLGVMHSEYFAGIAKYDYLAAANKISDSSAFSVSLIRFAVDNIPNTLELIDKDGNIRYDRIKSFSVSDYAFLISYARVAPIEGLKVGGSAKIIRRTAGDFASAWGFGFDLGGIYDYKKWKFGASFRDVTTTFNAWSFKTGELQEVFEMTGNEIPENSLELTLPKMLLGASREFPIYSKFSGLAEIDADFTFDGKRNVLVKSNVASIDPHLGVEINYSKLIFLRAGLGNIQQIENLDTKKEYTLQPNIGVGIAWKNLTIDYAFSNIGKTNNLPYSHFISLTYGIDKVKL